jgi:hypothetical protein
MTRGQKTNSPVINTPVNHERNRIIPYSPRNKRVKDLLLYSKLKPEINSLSPSLKSKGARLHSAIKESNQIAPRGIRKTPPPTNQFLLTEKPPKVKTKQTKITLKETS